MDGSFSGVSYKNGCLGALGFVRIVTDIFGSNSRLSLFSLCLFP